MIAPSRDSYTRIMVGEGPQTKPQPKPKPKPDPNRTAGAWELLLWLGVIYAGYRIIRQSTATRLER